MTERSWPGQALPPDTAITPGTPGRHDGKGRAMQQFAAITGIMMRSARPPSEPGTWEELMAAGQAGDRRAYDRLLREITPFLRAVACRRIRDRAEAEDAVQDALLSIHSLRHTYDPGRPLRPWIGAIVERRCIDRL